MRRPIALLIPLTLCACLVVMPDAELTPASAPPSAVEDNPGPAIPLVKLPQLRSASEVLTYQPPPTEPATVTSAASTPPATAPVPLTWEMIFDEWSRKLPGNWSIKDAGAWGATQMDSSELVFIARRTPARYLVAVMEHESMHVRQMRVYGGNYNAAVTGLAPYGGIEVNADCGALLMGANYTNYVKGRCTTQQTQAANAIMEGRQP